MIHIVDEPLVIHTPMMNESILKKVRTFFKKYLSYTEGEFNSICKDHVYLEYPLVESPYPHVPCLKVMKIDTPFSLDWALIFFKEGKQFVGFLARDIKHISSEQKSLLREHHSDFYCTHGMEV